MKRRGLLPVTLLTVLFTGMMLLYAGWLSPSSARPAPQRGGTNHRTVNDEDAQSSEAAWRWRSCQPTHWRTCMLQR